jgi:hypothetical protein
MATRPGLIASGGGGGDDDQNNEDDEEMFKEGEVIDAHFKVQKRLGRGGYGASTRPILPSPHLFLINII